MIRFPAEWEQQASVLVTWPHHDGDFSANMDAVESCYCQIAETINVRQQLIIICKDSEHQRHILQLLSGNSSDFCFVHADYNDIWIRDTAPITIYSRTGRQFLNFVFNGWGNKYPHAEDNALNKRLHQSELFKNTPMIDIDLVLEGGSIESDGQGTLLTTRQCLLNPNRNPHCQQSDIEARLKKLLGIKRLLWLDQENLEGDDTDAHIDTLARFCSPDTIAYTSCNNTNDRQYPGLKRMREQLQGFTTLARESYHLVALPLPDAIYDDRGQRLPANYANFLIINGAVLVPVYDDLHDRIALQRLAECFPGQDIIPILSTPLVHQYGSLHCMSMQIPSYVISHEINTNDQRCTASLCH